LTAPELGSAAGTIAFVADDDDVDVDVDVDVDDSPGLGGGLLRVAMAS
jgi:hypothetical protein